MSLVISVNYIKTFSIINICMFLSPEGYIIDIRIHLSLVKP